MIEGKFYIHIFLPIIIFSNFYSTFSPNNSQIEWIFNLCLHKPIFQTFLPYQSLIGYAFETVTWKFSGFEPNRTHRPWLSKFSVVLVEPRVILRNYELLSLRKTQLWAFSVGPISRRPSLIRSITSLTSLHFTSNHVYLIKIVCLNVYWHFLMLWTSFIKHFCLIYWYVFITINHFIH